MFDALRRLNRLLRPRPTPGQIETQHRVERAVERVDRLARLRSLQTVAELGRWAERDRGQEHGR